MALIIHCGHEFFSSRGDKNTHEIIQFHAFFTHLLSTTLVVLHTLCIFLRFHFFSDLLSNYLVARNVLYYKYHSFLCFERKIMDQAGISGMEKDVLKFQIEIMKKQADLERMKLSESIRE